MSESRQIFNKNFGINAEELTTSQKRLLQSLGPLLAHLISTDDEEEFFEAAKELIQLSASIVKQANFPLTNAKIPYGDQAIEYALDQLNEIITNSDPIKWDN